ncbi:MAG: Jag N-terminal domain-containing protein [Candidatus Magnetomorum sp.]|nr:Jag N-terminal domain-containing protein [Candidatus Magnetomorum sp.]
MTYLEFVGKTAEDAVQKACKELNTSKEKLKYDVVSFGSTGIFGLVGTKKAKIRVHSLDSYPKKSYREESQREQSQREESQREESQREESQKNENQKSVKEERPHSKKEESPEPEKEKKSDLDDSDPNDPLLSDEYVQKGFDVLKKIVEAITDDAAVSCSVRQGQIFFHIQGGNSAVLIGKHGQSLEAMQFLIDKIINKTRFKQKVRVRIDIEGYLRVREDNLTKLALRLGEKVKRSKRPETVSPMNAHDRRIIHLALKNDSTLKTQSIGSGYYRKLVIFPHRNRYS